eukprot:1329747-Amorphochlora_amoeboformis.AAC.2
MVSIKNFILRSSPPPPPTTIHFFGAVREYKRCPFPIGWGTLRRSGQIEGANEFRFEKWREGFIFSQGPHPQSSVSQQWSASGYQKCFHVGPVSPYVHIHAASILGVMYSMTANKPSYAYFCFGIGSTCVVYIPLGFSCR